MALILLLAGGWFLSQRQLARQNKTACTDLQTLLNWQHDAFLAGDGDLFFTFFAQDPAWRAGQLLPVNQAAHRAGFTITRVETTKDTVWANATWTEGGRTYQRLLFFESRNGCYQQISTDSDYWQRPRRHDTTWGIIENYPVDDEWLVDINSFVTDLCQGHCSDLTLVVTDDYAETAVSHTIHIPSPRIFAVDMAGSPAPAYWDLLEQRLTTQIRPVTIRIALPPRNFLDINRFDYETIANRFMAENPDIRVELVWLDDLPTDADQLAGFDGAAFRPTAALISAGAVYDLTPLVLTDSDFDRGDFYEQIWQGAWWQERMWFMPQAAGMKVLFYNRGFYREAGLAEPSVSWTWADMERDVQALAEVITAVDSPLHFTVFLDTDIDSLLAYAYSWQLQCTENAAIRCQTDLTPQRISAALTWQQQLLAAPALTPAPPQGNQVRWNWQAAIRVEEPIYYEHFLQMSPLGVASFPGTDRFNGITPLHLEGSFMTQASRHPLAVWRWLKFLSYQPPLPRYRLIPARPSVGEKVAFWQTLPRPLNDVMRNAFPYSRPILIGDKLWVGEEVITAVNAQPVTPQQAVPRLNWFSQN